MRTARVAIGSVAGAVALALALANSRQVTPATTTSASLAARASTGGRLSLSNTYERSVGHAIGDGLYPMEYIVQVGKETRLEVSDGVSSVWRLPSVQTDSTVGTALTVTFDAPGDYTLFLDDVEYTLSARRVRWELRTLDDSDREKYFSALHTMYTVDDKEGQEKFGPSYRSMDHLIRKHLYGAADRSCDHWHDDAAFSNHHIGVTLEMEEVLTLIEPSTAAHYWDYTQDANASYPWFASVVFHDDWFGMSSINTSTHVLNRGRFAYTAVKQHARGYSNTTNPYGYLRSPWNTNRVPYLSRSDEVMYLYDNGYSLPTCVEFADMLSGDVSLAELQTALNGYLHGPVHLMLGGFWGTESIWRTVSKYLASGHEFLLLSKFLWRQGYVRVPEVCSADTPQEECMPSCPSEILGDKSAEAVLRETGVKDLEDSLVQLALNYTSATETTLLDELCHVGFAGEMFTSAAPQDPIFWPLHGNAERYLQYARYLDGEGAISLDQTFAFEHESNVASDTGMVCDWSNVPEGSMELPTCTRETCPGHKEHDLIPFASVIKKYTDEGAVVDNAFFYNWTNPSNVRVPYVYDSLSTWPACTDGSIEVERNTADVHTRATDVQAHRIASRKTGFKKAMSDLGFAIP